MKSMRFDFVKNAKYVAGFTLLLLIAGVVSLILKGGFSLGIDFSGGKNIRVQIDPSISVNSEKLREMLSSSGVDLDIISIGDESDQEFFVYFQEQESSSVLTQKLTGALSQSIGAEKWTLLSEDYVGPKIGKEFQRIATQATLIILAILLIYVAFRFQFKFGVAAVLALFHDVLITLGFISLFDFQFDISILAAVLTIIGYSINDTIVIFDRIREESKNFHLESSEYKSVVNRSIVKSLTRTLMTSVTTLFALGALIYFGGIELRPMSIVMIVGILVGTYSSNFIAPPILVLWETYLGKKKKSLKTN